MKKDFDLVKAFTKSLDDMYDNISEKRDSLAVTAFRMIGIDILFMNPEEMKQIKVEYMKLLDDRLKREFYVNGKLKFTIIDNFENTNPKEWKYDIYFESKVID